MRFPLRILAGVREEVGDDFILEMRISGSERCEGGMPLEEVAEFCTRAQEYVNIIHVSAGVYRDPAATERVSDISPNTTGMYPSMYRPNISNLHEASYIKKRVSIPVCIVGGIRSPEDAEKIIAAGLVDLVAMGRQVNKADPNFANKVTANHPEEIDRCVRCGMCMGGTMATLRDKDFEELGIPKSEGQPEFSGPPTFVVPADTDFFKFFEKPLMGGACPDYCTVNPYHDRKDMMPDGTLPRTRVVKKILVIGGGMGGMQAAITAADIGFDVVLAEKTGSLGGTFKFADHDTHKYDLKIYKDRLIHRVKSRCWIDLRLNTEVDADFIKAEKPDFIICAVGAVQSAPPIPGLREYARPLLEAYGDNVRGKRVVMLGGGLAGCEAASDFADRGAKSVDIVEMMDTLAPGPKDTHKIDLFRLLDKLGVGQHPSTKVQKIEKGVVTADRNGETVTFEADLITYALGMKAVPTDELRAAAGETPFELVGDCVQPTKVYHAIYDGVTAAIRAYNYFNK
jgi:thioredoxin reductase